MIPTIGAASVGSAGDDGAASAAAPGIDGSSTRVAAGDPGNVPTPVETVSVARDGGRVRYDLQFSRPAGADRAWLVVRGPARVAETVGFERASGSGLTRLRWTGEEAAAVSLVVPANASDPDETATAAAWTFTRTPFVEFQWVADGSVRQVWPLAESRNALPPEAGAFGDRYALVGAHDTVTRTTPGGRVDLVVPAGAMSDAKAERVVDAIARAARDLDVGDRGDATLAFAAPDSVRWGGESVPARDEFWVNAGSRLDTAEAVWLHEYVHTRQSFRVSPEMRWIREAGAEYYAARLAREQGLIDRAAVVAHLDGPPSSATLTDSDTWEDEAVAQRKGARAMAVLDRRIREQTYGHRSLEDVFRRLNRHDGVVTYAVFEQTVAEVTGEPGDAWLERHVNGSAPVADQYGPDARPLGAAVLAGLGVGDASPTPAGAEDGLLAAVRGDGSAFFVVATGLSLVAALPLYELLRRRERRTGHATTVGSERSRAT